MMRLSDLDSKMANPSVVLVQSDCVRLINFLEVKLKRQYEVTADTSFYITEKEHIKTLKSLIGVYPPLALKWFAYVNLDELDRNKVTMADITAIVKQSNTVLFYIVCKKYATYKKFKDSIKTVSNVYDYYLSYLRKADFIYLYDAFVIESHRLNSNLFNFVTQTYSNKVDSCWDLFEALSKGTVCRTKADIVAICGSEDNTTEAFVFSLLKPLSKSERGFKRVFKQRVKTAFDLLNSTTFAQDTSKSAALGLSESKAEPSKLYAYMSNNLKNFIALKELIIAGKVYKSVPEDIIMLYNTEYKLHLDKYQRFIWRLNTIPLSSLLLLYSSMGDRWTSDADILSFLYRYYAALGKQAFAEKEKG